MKNIAVLGSTGSIGRNTLDVVARNRNSFRIVGLAAGRNIDLLEQQIKSFGPKVVAVADAAMARALKKKVRGVEVLAGIEGIGHVATLGPADFVMSSIVGAAGLLPTLAAVRAGKTVGLANKEALVMAGEIVIKEAKKNRAKIIPVDSEHSALFQCMAGSRRVGIRRLILTASGGPFYKKKKGDLKNIKAQDALKHPNWNMGRKITIDSATLMNKGLEVIEACRLFDLPPDRVDVLIHPQSIVHSMVEFVDRSCLAQMSVPDMRGPIAYALSYPERLKDPIDGLDLGSIASLTFLKPDMDMFPSLSHAYAAVRAGGTMPCVLNASNEVAVHAFLKDRIGFQDIPRVVEKTLEHHDIRHRAGIEEIIEADGWGRRCATKIIKELSR